MTNCSLCKSDNDLTSFIVEPVKTDAEISLCGKCQASILANDYSDIHHWHCLSEAIWHERAAVKVLSYSILNALRPEAWAQDLMDQIYLEPEELKWAKARAEQQAPEINNSKPTLDSNGTQLLEGDSATLIKDLDVKGGGFTAKRGTLVKNIRLTNNPEHIDARVNGVQIVLITKYLKKA